VRDFRPLVAELNTSIASVASSVNTMQAGVLHSEVISIRQSINQSCIFAVAYVIPATARSTRDRLDGVQSGE